MGERQEGGQAPDWLGELVVQGIEAIVVFDAQLCINYLNPAATELLKLGDQQIIGMNVLDFVHPEDLTRAGANITGLDAGANPRPGVIRLRALSRGWMDLELNPVAIDLPEPPDGPGPLYAVVLRDHDLSDAHWSFLASLSQASDFHQAVEQLARGLSSPIDGPLAISYEDHGGRRLAGSLAPVLGGLATDPPYKRRRSDVPGQSEEPVVGALALPPGTPWAEAVASGQVAWAPVDELPEPIRSEALRAGLGAGVAVAVPDPSHGRPALLVQWPPNPAMGPIVAEALVRRPREAMLLALERRHSQERLEELAHHDPLTHLANRSRFFEVLQAWRDTGHSYGVCYLDLDRFKPVNDTFGHLVGDAVLVECARRMEHAARDSDLVARLGGDEFAVVCVDVDVEELCGIAQRLVDAMAEPLEFDGRRLNVGASVGCALGLPGVVTDGVVAAADAALYAAKREGRGTWRLAGAAG